MFVKSALYSSLLGLALGKPIARRSNHIGSEFNIVPLAGVHDGNFFDVNSQTIVQFDSGVHSFDNFGGLPSLHGFDAFYGVNNFCGIQNVFVQESVVTCQVTQVSLIQQHLAIVAEYAKKIILTQSCETEAQVVLFNQWLGNLVGFSQDLRRVNGRAPTFDSVIANQVPSLVDLSGNINTAGFNFVGSSIGSHGVSVIGGNWHEVNSPISVGLTWDRVVLAAGPSIHLGNDCTSCLSTVPVHTFAHTTFVQPVHTPVHTPVFNPHETQVFNPHVTQVFNPHETQVFNPHPTAVFTTHEQVFNPHVTQVFNPHETQVFNPHVTQVFNSHETQVFNTHPTAVFTTHETFNPHVTTVQQHDPHATPVFDPHATTFDQHSTEEVFRKGTETSSADVSSQTDDVSILNTEVNDDAAADVNDDAAADAESDGFPETPDDPALGRRRVPAAVARRTWASRRRV